MPNPQGAPVLDPGTFAIARNGVSGHPVAWGWKKPGGGAAGQIEHFALYKVGDSADGFLRPNYASSGLGYTFTWIPDPQNPNQPLDHPNFAAWKAWVETAAIGSGMLVKRLTFVAADLVAGGVSAAAFLGVGLLRVRDTSNATDPVVALALRQSATTYMEMWRLSPGPNNPYRRPGAMNPLVDQWYFGQPPVDPDELASIVQSEISGIAVAADFHTRTEV